MLTDVSGENSKKLELFLLHDILPLMQSFVLSTVTPNSRPRGKIFSGSFFFSFPFSFFLLDCIYDIYMNFFLFFSIFFKEGQDCIL